MKEKFSFLTKKPFAHRGFHSGFTKEKGSIPENSLAAFMLAIEKKFSIEMDIHFTKDFNIIVFSNVEYMLSSTVSNLKRSKGMFSIFNASFFDSL